MELIKIKRLRSMAKSYRYRNLTFVELGDKPRVKASYTFQIDGRYYVSKCLNDFLDLERSVTNLRHDNARVLYWSSNRGNYTAGDLQEVVIKRDADNE